MNNHDSPPRPVIALDFDGTICQNAYPDIGEPNWNVIEKAKQCQEQGAYLILWTCRGGQMLEKAVSACTEWGLTFDAINEFLSTPSARRATMGRIVLEFRDSYFYPRPPRGGRPKGNGHGLLQERNL